MATARPLPLPALTRACVGTLCAVALLAGASGAPAAAATACPNANLAPTPGNVEEVRAAVACLIDRERARYGEAALRLNGQLAGAAQQHSREMAVEDYFAHLTPDGRTPLDRMRASGYAAAAGNGYVVGENIAWGTLWLATPQAIVAAWMASPSHRANILDAAFRETGVGVEPHAPAALAEGQPGALYTQDFGVVLSASHASRSAVGPGRITSRPATSERSDRHGSTRRQSRHRHRFRARHRARHRRAARRRGRTRAHQRSRRRRRRADR